MLCCSTISNDFHSESACVAHDFNDQFLISHKAIQLISCMHTLERIMTHSRYAALAGLTLHRRKRDGVCNAYIRACSSCFGFYTHSVHVSSSVAVNFRYDAEADRIMRSSRPEISDHKGERRLLQGEVVARASKCLSILLSCSRQNIERCISSRFLKSCTLQAVRVVYT